MYLRELRVCGVNEPALCQGPGNTLAKRRLWSGEL